MQKETIDKIGKSEEGQEQASSTNAINKQMQEIFELRVKKYKLFLEEEKEILKYREKENKKEKLAKFIIELEATLSPLVESFNSHQFPKVGDDIYASGGEKYCEAVIDLESKWKKFTISSAQLLENFKEITTSDNNNDNKESVPNNFLNPSTMICKLLDAIGKEDDDSKQLGDIHITRGEVRHTISDINNYYTSDFINLLLHNFDQGDQWILSIKTYPAITTDQVQNYIHQIKSSHQDYHFIPLNVAYDEKEPRHKNHWANLIIDKKHQLIFYLDPAKEQVIPAHVETLRMELNYQPNRIIQNPINFQSKENQEGWLRHCGAYLIEIFKIFQHYIRRGKCISGSLLPDLDIDKSSISLQTALSIIPCGEAEAATKIRENHIKDACNILRVDWKNLLEIQYAQQNFYFNKFFDDLLKSNILSVRQSDSLKTLQRNLSFIMLRSTEFYKHLEYVVSNVNYRDDKRIEHDKAIVSEIDSINDAIVQCDNLCKTIKENQDTSSFLETNEGENIHQLMTSPKLNLPEPAPNEYSLGLLSRIPNEILFKIMSYLQGQEIYPNTNLVSMSKTCRYFAWLANEFLLKVVPGFGYSDGDPTLLKIIKKNHLLINSGSDLLAKIKNSQFIRHYNLGDELEKFFEFALIWGELVGTSKKAEQVAAELSLHAFRKIGADDYPRILFDEDYFNTLNLKQSLRIIRACFIEPEDRLARSELQLAIMNNSISFAIKIAQSSAYEYLNYQNSEGETALHNAVARLIVNKDEASGFNNKMLKVCNILIKKGADTGAYNKKSERPIDYLAFPLKKSKSEEIEHLKIRLGQKPNYTMKPRR